MTWCPNKRAVNSRLRLTTQTGLEDALAGPDGGILGGNAELTSLALTAWANVALRSRLAQRPVRAAKAVRDKTLMAPGAARGG